MAQYEHLIVKDLPQLGEVKGRGQRFPFWLTGEMFPEVKIRVVAQDCSKMVNKPHSDPHTHDVSQVYLSITESPGDLGFEIVLGDETYVVESPFAVFIPAGVIHAHKVLKCDRPSYMLIIFLDYLADNKSE